MSWKKKRQPSQCRELHFLIIFSPLLCALFLSHMMYRPMHKQYYTCNYTHTSLCLILCSNFLVARAQTKFCRCFPYHIKGWTCQV
jgi:hypothetical protein